MSENPSVPPCPTPDGTPDGTSDQTDTAQVSDLQSNFASPDVPAVRFGMGQPSPAATLERPPSSPMSDVPNRRSEGVPDPHPLTGEAPHGTAASPGTSAIATGDGSGWIATCPTCRAELGNSVPGRLTHHDDGSHTWEPLATGGPVSRLNPDQWLTDGQDVVWPPDPQPQHSPGSPRVMAVEAGLPEAWRLPSHLVNDAAGRVSESRQRLEAEVAANPGPAVSSWIRAEEQLADTRREVEALERRLLEASQDRDRAQRLVEALWPANLLEARTVDGFPVIAAIVHERGRPTGEWSVQVERQSMTTDDGEVDVELVSLHRVTGRAG